MSTHLKNTNHSQLNQIHQTTQSLFCYSGHCWAYRVSLYHYLTMIMVVVLWGGWFKSWLNIIIIVGMTMMSSFLLIWLVLLLVLDEESSSNHMIVLSSLKKYCAAAAPAG